jgi:hypothetical protein
MSEYGLINYVVISQMVHMSVVLDFKYVTRKWARLRSFAGNVVESSLDVVRGGDIHIAQYFAKLLYFLRFTPTSVEKVLTYSLVKASRGFIEKNPSLYEVVVDEVPGFEPDEIDKVKVAFKSLSELGIAELIRSDRIKLKSSIIDGVIRYVAPYIAKNLNLHEVDVNSTSLPFRVISGVSALYVMHTVNRLPSSFTIMAGLLSPTAKVREDGTVESKTTIGLDEWVSARDHMAKLRPLRDRFDVEYFKAVGFLHENRVIVGTYPIEVVGSFVEKVIKPAYKRYYTLKRLRARVRG